MYFCFPLLGSCYTIIAVVIQGTFMLSKIINFLISRKYKRPAGNILKLQEKVLMDKLRNSYGTMISRKYGLETISSIADYQKRVPIHHFSDMMEFWCLEIEGTRGVTLNEKIKYFALSTGTTGEQKLIPVSKVLLKDNRKSELLILSEYVKLHPSSLLFINKTLGISGCARLGKTPSGAYYGMISGIMAETTPSLFRINFIPKKSTINITDWDKKSTAIAMETKGQKISCIFGIASTVVRLLKKIKAIYSKKEFEFFSKHLEALFLSGVNYRIYRNDILELLERNIDIIEYYAASEGIQGYQSPLNPEAMEFFYNSIFFEFIPYEDYLNKNYKNRLLITQLNGGESYVPCITSGNGAFSYIIGDVIQCVDSQIPLFKIKGRTTLTLNLVAEKTSIDAVEKTVSSLSQDLNASPGEFFVTGRIRNNKPNYVWVFEKNDIWDKKDKKWLSQMLDNYLSKYNKEYKYFIYGELNPSEVYFVDKSVFQNWYNLHKADLGHTKIPRITTDFKMTEYFFKNIETTF